MSVTTTNNVVINKLTLAQYKTLKANNQINANEVYSISDLDQHLVEMKDITSQDLNSNIGDIITAYGNDCTNKPNSQNGYLVNLTHSTSPANYNKQLWFIRNVNDVYIRTQEAGTFGDWVKIAQEPNIMTAYQGTSITVSSANASKYANFNLSNFSSCGSKLSISNGGIKIGGNVKRIKVSAQAQVMPTGGAGIKHIRIYRNNAIVGWNAHRFTATNENATLVIPERTYAVSEGDIIYLNYYGLAGDVFSGGNELQTVLTVEVVE